ncbi:Ger(x)C family spore germination protein [Clostridium estertheticum]|uniref:Ger(X)C family spore germination protein n=1 Tax=Clostridium estertheticum TaxID=238834 RepID=A0AA47EII9_9CLOT|nr:Ger(x)C family spore germination protein [Clostridium estertheticum]MBU3153310.1 Ger(x)C family spore germination protein [Clostridium estertheticum]WAG60720.1 Ger(x)C family spore germination protein [Clostridium estertheticum]
MKKTVYLFLKIMIVSFMALNLTGCWDNIELDKIAIVMGVGIDKTPQIAEVDMTVQVANTKAVRSSSTDISPKNTSDYFNLESTGDTIFSIVRGFSKRSNRKLFFAQNQVIILGRGIAEEGLEKYIDYFYRDHETRNLVWILICDRTANEILDIKSDFESIPSIGINALVKQQQYNSEAPMVDLQKFAYRLMSKTISPIAPLIKVSVEGNKKIAYVSGTAVFKKDKMIGEMNKVETRGVLWAIGEVKKGIIVTTDPGSNNKVSLEITRASSKIIPKIKNGKINIQIMIKEEGNLVEQSDSNDLANPKVIEVLEKNKDSIIKKEVMLAFKKAKSLDADVFGFGEAIHQKYPKEWKNMKNNWDETFKNINLDVVVDAKLRRIGRITKPISSK